MLDTQTTQPSKLRTKICVKIIDNSKGTHRTGEQTIFKTAMLKLILCDYGDTRMLVLVKGTITMTGGEIVARQADERLESNV